MKNKKELYLCLLILGIVVLFIGLYTFCENVNNAWSLRYAFGSYIVPLLFITAGAALIIFSAIRLAMINMVVKHPDTVHSIEIDAKDERQAQINQIARSRAFTAMAIIYAATIVLFVVLRYHFLAAFLLLIGGYAAGWLVYFFYLRKFAKDM